MKFFLSFLLCLLSCAALAVSEGQGVSAIMLDDALRAAYHNNPSILSQRAGFEASLESIQQAKAGRRPTLSAYANATQYEYDLQGNSFVTGEFDNTAKDYGVAAQQPLFTGFSVPANIDAATLAAQAQRLSLQSFEQDILRQTVAAYMDVLLANYTIQVNKNNLNRLEKQLQAAEDRNRVGEITGTDVAQARSRYEEAQASLTQATGAAKAARATFVELTGIEPSILSDPELAYEFLPQNLEQSKQMAAEQNLLLRAANYNYQAAERDIDSEFGDLLPQLNLVGAYEKAYDPGIGNLSEQGVASIGLSATINLYDGGASRSQLRQAKRIAEQRAKDITQLQKQLDRLVTQAWENVVTSRTEISSRMAQVEAARLASKGTYQEYLVGERSILDSLDAEQDLLDAEIALATARRNEVVASFKLAQYLGRITSEYFDFEDRGQFYKDKIARMNDFGLGLDLE